MPFQIKMIGVILFDIFSNVKNLFINIKMDSKKNIVKEKPEINYNLKKF